jgi:signal transduction histidine kinase
VAQACEEPLRGLSVVPVGASPREPATSPGRAVGLPSWQVGVAVAAVLASVAAVWVTLDAAFLAHPGWLAVQKADFILGPVFVGLYWLRRRPRSRFGPVLIGFGFVGALYVLQSASNEWLFSIGLLWENVVGLAAYVLILAFPTGRLDSLPARLILVAATLLAVVPAIIILLLLPQVGAGGSISSCAALCPRNTLAVTSNPGLALDLWELFRWAVIGVALATIAFLVHRMVTGTPAQRRAHAIGTPIALVFLVLQVVFHLLAILAPEATGVRDVVAWTFAGARAALWYGFLFALLGAELFANRALRALIDRSLRRPTQRELEGMIAEQLGDRDLQLWFRHPRGAAWLRSDDDEPRADVAEPGPRRSITSVKRDGTPAVALVHDVQLDDDPELLEAAGVVALLAQENAELDSAWHDALMQLRSSRARVVQIGDEERRKFERNLHDGVQQRLVALRIGLGMTGELAAEPPIRERLQEATESVDEALAEVRSVGQGLYSPVLADLGLVPALGHVRSGVDAPLRLRAYGVNRQSSAIEAAVYYACSEAVQNAAKHGGRGVQVSVALHETGGELRFEVSDDGAGFDLSLAHDGTGLQNMRDRLGAVDGRISIRSAPGRGTVVSGVVPLSAPDEETALAVDSPRAQLRFADGGSSAAGIGWSTEP